MLKVMRQPRGKIRAKIYLSTRNLNLGAHEVGVSENAPRGFRGTVVLRVLQMKAFARAGSCSSANDDIAASRALAKAADACDDARALDCQARSGRDFAEPDRRANPDARSFQAMRHRSAHWGQAVRD